MKKVSPHDQVVWKNSLIKNKSGGGSYTRVIDEVGRDLMRPVKLEEVQPDKEYYIRPNGDSQNYYPVTLSNMADYSSIKSFVAKGILCVKNK